MHSDVFEKSIRHELVKRTLQEKIYDHGARNFLPMPLAVRKSSDHTVEWACSTLLLGGMAEKNNCFRSCNDSVCVKLLGSGVSKGRPDAISGALCKNFFDSTEFEVQAKKYILAAADVDNARLLLDSGWTLDGLPALVCEASYDPGPITDTFIRVATSSSPLWLLARLYSRPSSWERSVRILSGSAGRESLRLIASAIQTTQSRFPRMIRSHKSTALCQKPTLGMHSFTKVPALKRPQESTKE